MKTLALTFFYFAYSVLMYAWICTASAAVPVTLAWDKNPEPDVVGYRLTFVRVPELVKTLTTSSLVATTPDLLPGVWTFSVAAINKAGLVSKESEAVVTTIADISPLSPSVGPLFVLSETSDNLKDWKPANVTVLDPSTRPSKFVRNSVLTLEELIKKLTPTF
jgi:hypothetical protein